MEEIDRELEAEEGIEMKLLDYNLNQRDWSKKARRNDPNPDAPDASSYPNESSRATKKKPMNKKVTFNPNMPPKRDLSGELSNSKPLQTTSKQDASSMKSQDLPSVKEHTDSELSRDAISLDPNPRLIKVVQIDPFTGKKVTKIKKIVKKKRVKPNEKSDPALES